jgi:hypothetical protein
MLAAAESDFENRGEICFEINKDVKASPSFGQHVGEEYNLLKRRRSVARSNRSPAILIKREFGIINSMHLLFRVSGLHFCVS